jgi:predicted RNA polymerase sigma factor
MTARTLRGAGVAGALTARSGRRNQPDDPPRDPKAWLVAAGWRRFLDAARAEASRRGRELAVHAEPPTWQIAAAYLAILQAEWYGELLLLTGSPVVRLNRAVAVGEADGPRAGLAALADVSPDLPVARPPHPRSRTGAATAASASAASAHTGVRRRTPAGHDRQKRSPDGEPPWPARL